LSPIEVLAEMAYGSGMKNQAIGSRDPLHKTPWLTPDRYASVATRTELQVPIESVPIGSRVPTKNPNRFEVDPQPEPDEATWAKLSITVERSDGGIVDAEIIRPRSWFYVTASAQAECYHSTYQSSKSPG
jgi:hypothetical protein